MSSEISPGAAAADALEAEATAQYLVLSKTFEAMLKKPEDDNSDSEADAGVGTVSKSLADGIAQAATGFGL
jgi:hypothetical protein